MSQKLVSSIKQAAVEAVEAGKPVVIKYGTVTSVSPLLIQVDQKLTLDSDFLVLTRSVKSRTIVVNTGSALSSPYSHNHSVTVVIDDDLKVGDVVILLREQGGQKFCVLDKVVSS